MLQLFVCHELDGRFGCNFHNVDAVASPQTPDTSFVEHVTGAGSQRAKSFQTVDLLNNRDICVIEVTLYFNCFAFVKLLVERLSDDLKEQWLFEKRRQQFHQP